MVNGVLYAITPLYQAVAIDAATGETLWIFNPKSYETGTPTMSIFWQHRGPAYWTDGTEERIYWGTGDAYLIALDAKTGRHCADFGENGRLDLMDGIPRANRDDRDYLNALLYSCASPPLVVRDVIVTGSSIADRRVKKESPPGWVRGWDARTGALKWVFHTVPQEGEFGVDTWEDDSWKYSGNTNVWTQMSADEELGYVYLPTGTPTNDFYGGHRLGDNLFAESLICVDVETGERVWHFQTVHHGLWDYDLPAAPNLVDIEVDGKKIKAVAQVSKQGFTYVFDRVTGKPVWPIEERAVNYHSEVPGEQLSKTQPFPTKPPAFERQGIGEDDLIDFTPELREEALAIVEDFVIGPLFTPNIVEGANGKKAMLQLPGAAGGENLPGTSVDPETGYLYVQSQTGPSLMSLYKPDPNRSDLDYMIFLGAMGASKGPQGLPLLKPPYRRITAIDLNKGEIAWQIPFGEGPTQHPALKDLNLGPLGSPFPEGVISEGGILVTKTLLITFLVDVDELGDRSKARGSWLQAYDKATGKLLGQVKVDRHLHSSPMTAMHDGRQYILVASGGVTEPSELIAFGLPRGGP